MVKGSGGDELRAAVRRLVPSGQRSMVDMFGPGWGPRVVALGGGTGLSVLLRGLKKKTHRITAVVTVADDGGSSGRLRDEMGMLPPGDIRACLVALADAEPLMRRLFQYRFTHGEGLQGHTFGNLFIAAMTEITGDFQEALRLSSRVLAVKGRVLPATLESVVLRATMDDGSIVQGESAISGKGGVVRRVCLEPPSGPLPETLDAISEADVIVIGPGSLYTSILPALLVEGIAEAISRSSAVKIYVCNIMTQSGETLGYTATDHVRAIQEHVGRGITQCVIVNDTELPPGTRERYRAETSEPVAVDTEALRALGLQVVRGDLAHKGELARHNPERLADTIMAVLESARPGWRRWGDLWRMKGADRKRVGE